MPYAQQLAVASTTFSATTTGATTWLPLSGQTYCTITFTTVPTTFTATVQGASDAPSLGTETAVTVTGIGANGVITNPSAGTSYGGLVLPQAATYIRLNITALSGGSGTAAGSISCSPGFGLPTAAPYLSVGSSAQGLVADVPAPGATASAAALAIQSEPNAYPVPVFFTLPYVQTVTSSITSATTTQVLAGVANEYTDVDFAEAISRGTESAAIGYWEYGTGTNCGTGTTSLWTAGGNGQSLAASSGSDTVFYGGYGNTGTNGASVPQGVIPAARDFRVPAGNSICFVTSGTTINVSAYFLAWQHY